MGTSFTLFRVGDTEVRVHWSFLLILIYGAYTAPATTEPWVGIAYGIGMILLLFACVTLHEFGHALAARRYGIGVPTITLLPIGGLARLERAPARAGQELVIALAGPLVNVAIALLLAPILVATVALQTGTDMSIVDMRALMRNAWRPSFLNMLANLTVMNLLLAFFNLLPAFPMDGGRVLRALLAMVMSQVRATRVAVFVGRIMAILLAIAGIVNGNIALLLIAFFVYIGGSAEREAVETRAALKGMQVGRVLHPGTARLYSSERLEQAVALALGGHQSDFPVLDLGGTFVGVLTRSGLARGLHDQGADARVVDVMTPADQIPVFGPDADLADIWERMGQSGSRVVAIEQDHTFLGLVSIDDVAQLMQLEVAQRHGRASHNRSEPTADGAPDG